MLRAKITQGHGGARWTTRVTIPSKLAPFYNITETTRWTPNETARTITFRPATKEEISRGKTWKTIDVKKHTEHPQLIVSIPIVWAECIDLKKGVVWNTNGTGFYGEVHKKKKNAKKIKKVSKKT